MTDLKIEITEAPSGARLLSLSGPLTINTLFEFQSEVRNGAALALFLDLAAVPYMDSAGLGSVLGAMASCQRTGRRFALIGVSSRVVTLLEMSRVYDLLPLFANLEEAEQALSKSAGA